MKASIKRGNVKNKQLLRANTSVCLCSVCQLAAHSDMRIFASNNKIFGQFVFGFR